MAYQTASQGQNLSLNALLQSDSTLAELEISDTTSDPPTDQVPSNVVSAAEAIQVFWTKNIVETANRILIRDVDFIWNSAE
jgi:hypothetical protein